MLEKNERETIIIINPTDLAEGYFVFGTSERSHFARLCKRIGGRENLIEVRENKDKSGEIVWYDCRVPSEYFSLRTFAIRKKAIRNTTKAMHSRMARMAQN